MSLERPPKRCRYGVDQLLLHVVEQAVEKVWRKALLPCLSVPLSLSSFIYVFSGFSVMCLVLLDCAKFRRLALFILTSVYFATSRMFGVRSSRWKTIGGMAFLVVIAEWAGF